MNRRLVLHVVAAGVIATAVSAPAQPTTTVPLDLWGPSATVTAVARVSDTLYVGGEFGYVGPSTGPLAVLDASTGEVVKRMPRVAGSVTSSVALPDGGYVIAGQLWFDGDTTQMRSIARVDAALRLVSTWTAPVGEAGALAADGTTVYAAGRFEHAGTGPAPNLGAIDLATGAVRWRRVVGTGGGEAVIKVVAHRGRLYASARTTFDTPLITMDGATGEVLPSGVDAFLPVVIDFAAEGDSLYVTGVPAGSASGPRGVVVDVTNGAVRPWNVPATAGLLALGAGRIIAGSNGELIELDPLSGQQLGAPFDRNVFRLASDPATGRFYVARYRPFITAGVEIVAYDFRSLTPLAWSAAAISAPSTLAPQGGLLGVGGPFQSAGGVTRTSLYAVNLRTGRPTAFAPVILGRVNALAVVGTTLIAGGAFRSVNGQPHTSLAVFDLESGASLTWPAHDGTVDALAVAGEALVVGGTFDVMGGESRSGLAALDPRTGRALPWRPQPNGRVRAIATVGDAVVIAGDFTTIDGVFRPHAAAFLGVGAAATVWDPAADGPVTSLATASNRLAVAGAFTSLAGQPAPGAGMFDFSGRAVAPLAHPLLAGVDAVAGAASQLYVAGRSSPTTSTVAGVFAVDGRPTGWAAPLIGASSPVTLLRQLDGQLVVGGVFRVAGSRPLQNLAVFETAADAPRRLRSRLAAATFSLSWEAALGTAPTSYLVDAYAGGQLVGTFPVNGQAFTAVAPPGTYEVAVRPVGSTAASSRVPVTVPEMTQAPAAPVGLTGTTWLGGTSLSWAGMGGAGNAESFVIEAGTASGLADVAAFDTGVVDTTFITAAPPGLYYVRIRARNAYGLSAPSNEIFLQVP